MPLLPDTVFSSDGASPSPYGIPPGLDSEGRRQTPDHARRTWKAYHERQALVAEKRQLSRPVNIDSILWGDLLGEKLAELIEGERNHPRTIVSGGAADRDGEHCLLPELDDGRVHSGHDQAVAAAVGKPKVLRFSAEGSEYTADDFGAGGDFTEMYERRYAGFDARTKKASGRAAERAWSRTGRPGDRAVGESHREKRSRERTSREAQSIPWDLGTNHAGSVTTPETPSDGGRGGGGDKSGRSRSREGGIGGSRGSGGGSGLAGSFGNDLFAGDAASALAAGHDKGGQQLDSDLQSHPSPHIGPDTHCLIPDEVEEVHKMHDEEKADGSNASLATQMQHRLVPMGGGAGGARKLRGTAAVERQELARVVMKDRYVEEAVRRNRAVINGDNASGSGDDDDDDSDDKANSTTCSVTTFEAYYTRATTAADALPTVERGLNEEQPDVIPEETRVLPVETPVVVLPPNPAALEKETKRAERKAERAARLEAKRDRVKRSAVTLYSNGSEAPSSTLPLRRTEGGGVGGSGFVDARDEISIAPSMSSLGSFDEQSGSAPVLQHAQEADTTDRPLPAVLHLAAALDHTAGKNQNTSRRRSRRSRRSIPHALPSATITGTGAGIEEGSTCYFPATAASVERVLPMELERSSSRLGIAFGGAGKRRRSRRLSSSSSSSSTVGVGLEDSPLAAEASQDIQNKPFASSGRPLTGSVGVSGAPTSSSTMAVASAALLKGKVNWWRGRSKPPTKVPRRSPALTTLTVVDGLSRGAAGSSVSSCSRWNSDCGDGRPARDASTVSMTSPVSGAISREPPQELPAARAGVTDDEQSLTVSITSSLTSLGGSVRGLIPVGPLAERDSSVASFASTLPASGSAAQARGRSVAGSATTVSLAAARGPVAGLAGAGARVGDASAAAGAGDRGAGGGTHGRLDSVEGSKSRKKQHEGGGTGAVQRVHKINLGSKRHQKSMQPAERTTLLIGACESSDLQALERLLELGASPLDPYSPSVEGSRCVFCQFFLFVLQVGAGLRPRLAPDDSLHTRALAMLIEARLEDNPLFLSIPKLRDQDNRGFCLLHHAAAFGNASKVEFLLERGVNPDERAGGEDETALLIAARRGQRLHLRVAAALIRSGATMFARDRKGMTALHHAADVGRKHMCHYLLLVGADKAAQDNEGRTPLDLCHGKHPRASAVLRSFAGCKPPPATILNYMEKVEVQGLDDSTAQELMLQEQAKREEAAASEAAAAAASAADPAGAADAIFGDDENSMASWDAASLGGMSGDRASVLSLGTVAIAGRRGR